MSQYDFSKLNDKEFESLVVELLSRTLHKRIERFKPGKDKGVDGRYFTASSKEVVLQCKHWLRSDIRKLIKYLESHEAEKVRRLNPNQYLFITSLELSRENKRRIKEIFSPHIRSDDDIFGS